jgi:hypothetical protein
MRKIGDSIELSASDLVAHLNCRLTDLDIAVANGTLAKPKYWDPVARDTFANSFASTERLARWMALALC